MTKFWSHLLIASVILNFGLMFTSGCGVYSFSGHGIGGVESIALETFDNQTAEFGIREQLADVVLNQLLKDRTLSVVDRGAAHAVLSGNILSIDDNPLTYDENEVVSEFEIRITVSFSLREPDKSEPIWEGSLTGAGSYPYSTGSIDERQQGIDKALDRLALELVNKLTSDW